MRRLTSALALACTLLACSREGSDPEAAMLPAASPAAGGITTGDLAGPPVRTAEFVRNPYEGDPEAGREGERLYRQMNCADCHGYKGEGLMCPSLTDGEWLFGDTPADKFTSIHSGRARGMPAYGRLLPEEQVWKLVTYLDELKQRADAQQPRRGGGGLAQATQQAQGPEGGRH